MRTHGFGPIRSAACLAVLAIAWLTATPARGGAAHTDVRSDAAGAPLIAYEVGTDGLWTVRRSGRGHRSIVPGGKDPAWSPGGTQLLYTAGALYSARPDGSKRRLILDPARLRGPLGAAIAVHDPASAPHGRRVAFSATYEDAEERELHQIYTAQIDGSHVRRLRRGNDPAWSADGRRLYFVLDPRRRDSFSSRIARMRRDGSHLRVLLDDAIGYRHDLELSPDGRTLAYLETSSAPGFSFTLIHVRDLRSGRTYTIPWAKSGSVLAITWTPGGSRIAYIENTSGVGRAAPSPIVTIRPDGTGRRREFTLPYDEYYGTWADQLAWQPSAG